MKFKYTLILLLTVLSSSIHALEGFTGKVTVVEPSYLPGSISFKMSVGNSTCRAGAWLKWSNPDKDNNKAVYSTLMAALMSGKKVTFYIGNRDTTCKGRHLHLHGS